MTTTSAATARRRAEDGLEPGLAEHVHRAGVLVEQPVGAEPDLVGRFLAAGVEHGAAGGLEPRRGLQQQRGLADARLAADQDHRARARSRRPARSRTRAARCASARADAWRRPAAGRAARRQAGTPRAALARAAGPARARDRPAPRPPNSTRRTPRSGPPTSGARGRTRCSGRRTWVWPWRSGGPASSRGRTAVVEPGVLACGSYAAVDRRRSGPLRFACANRMTLGRAHIARRPLRSWPA